MEQVCVDLDGMQTEMGCVLVESRGGGSRWGGMARVGTF